MKESCIAVSQLGHFGLVQFCDISNKTLVMIKADWIGQLANAAKTKSEFFPGIAIMNQLNIALTKQ